MGFWYLCVCVFIVMYVSHKGYSYSKSNNLSRAVSFWKNYGYTAYRQTLRYTVNSWHQDNLFFDKLVLSKDTCSKGNIIISISIDSLNKLKVKLWTINIKYIIQNWILMKFNVIGVFPIKFIFTVFWRFFEYIFFWKAYKYTLACFPPINLLWENLSPPLPFLLFNVWDGCVSS